MRKKILILAANPKDATRRRLDEEARDIREGLERAKKRDEFEIVQRWAVRPRDLQRAMLDESPQIVHFTGHSEGAAGLVFEDEAGNAKLVTGNALAKLFKLFKQECECVVLNGCYSLEQAAAIAEHIPYVIGMSKSINEQAAIKFAVGFYDAMVNGRSVEFAFNSGKVAMDLANIGDSDAPVLLMGSVISEPQQAFRNTELSNLVSAIWNLPYEQNNFFTGREEILQTLYKQLNHNKAAASSQIQAISGLGGIGKTQTAIEYVYRHCNEYQSVFWVRAETDLDLRTGFIEIANLLNLPHKDAQNPNNTIQAVKHWLETHSDWLLIFDNANHPEQIKSFCPHRPQGHILLTSCEQTFDTLGIARPIRLQKMLTDEAKDFLFKRTGRDSDQSTEQAAAAKLAKELGYLPLALEQAGAYILAKQISFQDYLKSYLKHRLKLLEKSGPITGNYPESVATTWSLSFREVEAISTEASDLLRISAFLSPDAIPYELFELGASQLGENLANALTAMSDDPIVFHETLAPLTRYSLVQSEPSKKVYSIARLVQEVVRSQMDEESHRLWTQRTINALAHAFPDEQYINWKDCSRLLPHARVIIQSINTEHIESISTALLLNLTGSYLHQQGQYNEAEPLYEHALLLYRRLLNNKHPNVARSLSNMALLYESQGRYSEAEAFLLEALKMLNNDSPDLANCLNNLALLYDSQGRYSEAESLYQEALTRKQCLVDKEHLDIAKTFDNLATVYEHQGHYKKAELFHQKALTMYQQLLGHQHSLIASNLNNLAVCCIFRNNPDKAETFCQEALAMLKQLFGKKHPHIAKTLNNLASVYKAQDRYNEAELSFQDSLAMIKQLLGDEHPDVAIGLNNLALLYNEQGFYSKAEPLFQKSLTMNKKLLGSKHPNIALSLNNLAICLHAQGRYSEAEPLYREALAMRKYLLGYEHPDVENTLKNLEALYNHQGNHNEAQLLHRESLIIQNLVLSKQLLGTRHPSTISSLKDLAEFYANQGYCYEAEQLYQKTLTISENILGPTYSLTKRVRDNLQKLQKPIAKKRK
ncbi:CHAT domain-containing protein [Leptolyngbyaceae cyanobacterium CCMR0081]|uniref:CHAT domain-containing protein n=2 Tax=Adonisia TaxID=2950183 RepID=A0A6M0RVV3_9CYAN|nr:tetratricopeptide repeat protein [Adonisia turfae]NEZ59842.1 CHAT domain-containing protein [Adonisia turfae CCMR0081]